MILQDKRKQQPGRLKSLVMLNPCEMSASLVNKTRSEVALKVNSLEGQRRQKTEGLFGGGIMSSV